MDYRIWFSWLDALPLSAGAHKVLDGTFTLLEFQRGLPAINVEASNAGLMLDEPDDVASFRRTLDKLNETAMSEEESLQLIATYAAKFEDESGCSTETQSSGGAHPATAGSKRLCGGSDVIHRGGGAG